MSTPSPDSTSISDEAPHNHTTSLLIQKSQQYSISEYGAHLRPNGPQIIDPELGIHPIQVNADHSGSQSETPSPARAVNPSNKRKRIQSTDDEEEKSSDGSQSKPPQPTSVVGSTNATKHKKLGPFKEREKDESSDEEFLGDLCLRSMSSGVSSALSLCVFSCFGSEQGGDPTRFMLRAFIPYRGY